jgi:hypothetical protein
MNTIPRPKLYEFMLRGIRLEDADALLARWEELSPAELIRWSFAEPEMTEPVGNVVPFRLRRA